MKILNTLLSLVIVLLGNTSPVLAHAHGKITVGKQIIGGNEIIAAIDEHPIQEHLSINSLRYSTNGGITWNTAKISSDTRCVDLPFNTIKYLANSFWIVGPEGKICQSSNGQEWLWRLAQSNLNSYDLYDITYGNPKGSDAALVAVGYDGTIMYAHTVNNDENYWSWANADVEFNPLGHSLHSVAYGENVFVTVGDYATIGYSTDGKTWHAAQTTGDANFYRVIYAKTSTDPANSNGLFLAVGQYNTIWTSKNGVNWVSSTGLKGHSTFVDVAYRPSSPASKTSDKNDSLFVAISDGVVAYSDGITDPKTGAVNWTVNSFRPLGLSNDLISVHPTSIVYSERDNTFFVTFNYESSGGTGGGIAYSLDGKTWFVATTSGNQNYIGPLADITAATHDLIATPEGDHIPTEPPVVLTTITPSNWKEEGEW